MDEVRSPDKAAIINANRQTNRGLGILLCSINWYLDIDKKSSFGGIYFNSPTIIYLICSPEIENQKTMQLTITIPRDTQTS